jgi:hypothetical protein
MIIRLNPTILLLEILNILQIIIIIIIIIWEGGRKDFIYIKFVGHNLKVSYYRHVCNC